MLHSVKLLVKQFALLKSIEKIRTALQSLLSKNVYVWYWIASQAFVQLPACLYEFFSRHEAQGWAVRSCVAGGAYLKADRWIVESVLGQPRPSSFRLVYLVIYIITGLAYR